jgi:hypothetical protein
VELSESGAEGSGVVVEIETYASKRNYGVGRIGLRQGRTQVFYNVWSQIAALYPWCIDVLLSQRSSLEPHFEQESHVILLNFARNSVRKCSYVSGVRFLDSSLKITLKGSHFPEKSDLNSPILFLARQRL